MCTTPSTRGLITPPLSCQLRNTQVLRPPSRAEAGKSRQPFVPAERCVLHSGNVLLSNLLPMKPWDAQQLLILILKLKPSFLKHVMLEHLDHDRACLSNSKCYMLFSCRFSNRKKPLLQRTESHRVRLLSSQRTEHCVCEVGQPLHGPSCVCTASPTLESSAALPGVFDPAFPGSQRQHGCVCWAPRLTLTGASGQISSTEGW